MEKFWETIIKIKLSRTIEGFKLNADCWSGRDLGSQSSEASTAEKPVAELYRVLRAGRESKDSPVVKLYSTKFRNHSAEFLVDPGTDMNLIKTEALLPELELDPKNSVLLAGITNDPVRTIGTLKVPILDTPVEFHVMKNNFPVSSNGILGRLYLRKEQAQLSFRHNTLVTISKPITPILFIDEESRRAKEALKSEIKPFSRLLKIQAGRDNLYLSTLSTQNYVRVIYLG